VVVAAVALVVAVVSVAVVDVGVVQDPVVVGGVQAPVRQVQRSLATTNSSSRIRDFRGGESLASDGSSAQHWRTGYFDSE
jgi:hypothetical protein